MAGVAEVAVDAGKPYEVQRTQLEDGSVAPGTIGYTTMEFTVDVKMTDEQFRESMERHAEGRALQIVGPTSSQEVGFKTYAVRFGVHLDPVRIEKQTEVRKDLISFSKAYGMKVSETCGEGRAG